MPKWSEERPCPLLSSYKRGNSICGEYSGILATLGLLFTLLLIIPSPHLRLATTAHAAAVCSCGWWRQYARNAEAGPQPRLIHHDMILLVLVRAALTEY